MSLQTCSADTVRLLKLFQTKSKPVVGRDVHRSLLRAARGPLHGALAQPRCPGPGVTPSRAGPLQAQECPSEPPGGAGGERAGIGAPGRGGARGAGPGESPPTRPRPRPASPHAAHVPLLAAREQVARVHGRGEGAARRRRIDTAGGRGRGPGAGSGPGRAGPSRAELEGADVNTAAGGLAGAGGRHCGAPPRHAPPSRTLRTSRVLGRVLERRGRAERCGGRGSTPGAWPCSRIPRAGAAGALREAVAVGFSTRGVALL